MRDIKFRAFCTMFSHSQMYYDLRMYVKGDGVWWGCNDDAIMFQQSSRRCFLMQFTGLQDKDGKDIYEGDILKLDENPDIVKGTEFYNIEDVSHHEIYWDNERAMFCDKRLEDGESLAGYLDGDISFVSDCKIIGNIWEHPELINKNI